MKTFTFFGMQSDYGINLVALILLFIPLAQRLVIDYITIVVDRLEVQHRTHTWITGVVMGFCSILDGSMYHDVWWQHAPKAFAFSFGIFFLLFDYGLNLMRGRKWNYIDQDAVEYVYGMDKKNPVSSASDILYAKIGPWPTLALKLWVALLGFSIYFFWSYVIS